MYALSVLCYLETEFLDEAFAFEDDLTAKANVVAVNQDKDTVKQDDDNFQKADRAAEAQESNRSDSQGIQKAEKSDKRK